MQCRIIQHTHRRYHKGEQTNTESEQVVMDCTGIMTTVNPHNHGLIQMCDDIIAQSDVKPNISIGGVCLKHEETCSKEATYPSVSTLTAACEGECGETDATLDKSIHGMESFTRLAKHPSGDKTHKCDQCITSFHNKSTLTRHIRVHSGDKPYKCDQCMKSFSRKSTLAKNIRIHSGDKPY
jgi:uncharacterized Zn-finger protein